MLTDSGRHGQRGMGGKYKNGLQLYVVELQLAKKTQKKNNLVRVRKRSCFCLPGSVATNTAGKSPNVGKMPSGFVLTNVEMPSQATISWLAAILPILTFFFYLFN